MKMILGDNMIFDNVTNRQERNKGRESVTMALGDPGIMQIVITKICLEKMYLLNI